MTLHTAPTVTRYIDLLRDRLVVRRLLPLLRKSGKRRVKSPRCVRDSGLVHASLGLRPSTMCRPSGRGYVLEGLGDREPDRRRSGAVHSKLLSYGSGSKDESAAQSAGHGLWTIGVERSLSAGSERIQIACEVFSRDHRIVVYAGSEQYRVGSETTAIGLPGLAER